MKYMEFIKPSIAITQILLVVVGMIMLSAFAIKSTDSGILTNALLSIVIVAQLFTVNVLLHIYERLGGRKK